MTGAIALEFWYFQAAATSGQQLAIPSIVLWGAHFVLVAHGIEGVVAAVYAVRQQRSPFFYAIYTFFVGTVGLIELSISNPKVSE